MSDDRKDYIINLRVSRDTYEKLKSRATENRETLSNLTRKVIDDGLEIVNDLSDELFGAKKSSSDIVYTYQVHLEQERKCDECRCVISKGETVTIAELQSGRKRCLCSKCYL